MKTLLTGGQLYVSENLKGYNFLSFILTLWSIIDRIIDRTLWEIY